MITEEKEKNIDNQFYQIRKFMVVCTGYLMGYFTKLKQVFSVLKQVLSILVIMAVISVSLIEIWTLIKGFLADG